MKNSFVVVNRFSSRLFKNYIRIGLGEIAVGEADIDLRIPVLSSCIGLVFYIEGLPRNSRIACMAHIMYPSSVHPVNPQHDEIGLGKYADQAVKKMVTILTQRGYPKEDIYAKMACEINLNENRTASGTGNWKMNSCAIIELLKHENIPLMASYLGGSKMLEAVFRIREHKLLVTPIGEPTIIL